MSLPMRMPRGLNPAGDASRLVPQHELVHDLVFVAQGMDGAQLRVSSDGSKFVVHDRQRTVLPSTRACLSQLETLSAQFAVCQRFVDRFRTAAGTGQFKGSAVRRALSQAIGVMLNEYKSSLSEVHCLLAGGPAHEASVLSFTATEQVERWAHRLALLARLVDHVRAMVGAELLSHVCSLRLDSEGDQESVECLDALLDAAVGPLHGFLVLWIGGGRLMDDDREFFIESNLDCLDGDSFDWAESFSVRTNKLPSMMSPALADTILLVGKSIYFLKEICCERLAVPSIVAATENLSKLPRRCLYSDDLQDQRMLHACVREAAAAVGDHLMHVLLEKCQLVRHMDALKTFLLLTGGDFCSRLLMLLQEELSKPATSVVMQRVLFSVSTALESSFAFHTVPAELRSRLDVRKPDLSNVDDTVNGWDTFVLDYRVDGPIATIVPPIAMRLYDRLFSFMWRLHRLHHFMRLVPSRLATSLKPLSATGARVAAFTQSLTHACVILLDQLRSHFVYKVIEGAWSTLQTTLTSCTSVDALCRAHHAYITTIAAGVFMPGSAVAGADASSSVYHRLVAVLDHVLAVYQFCGVELHERAVREGERRSKVEAEFKRQSMLHGGNSDDEMIREQHERQRFDALLSTKTYRQMALLGEQFKHGVCALLLALSGVESDHLRSLAIALDYGGFYGRQEPRLGDAMTYGRLSMVRQSGLTPMVGAQGGHTGQGGRTRRVAVQAIAEEEDGL